MSNVADSMPDPESTNVRIPWSTLATAGAARALGTVWPRASARVAHRLWSRPQRFDRPQREHDFLSTAEQTDLPLGMGHIRTWTWGSGPTILLVHGWEGRGTQLASFVKPLVDLGYRVATFDAPAHGDSRGSEASIFTFADAIHRSARQLGPLHGLVAHSMGGAASLLALAAGLPAKRVVFIAPADASKAIDRFGDAVGLPPQVRRLLSNDVRDRYGAPLASVSPDLLAAQLQAPALVIHDQSDRFVPLGDGERIVSAWPGAELHVTEGLGHHRILRDASVIARSVQFLHPNR